MGMNKKEQAAFEELQRQLRLAKAMRFTEAVERDVLPPKSDGLEKGWDYNAYIGGPRVEKACTSCISHAFGSDDKTTTQNPKRIFSTKLMALRAMRVDVEKQAATILAKIDEQIEEEKARNP